MRRVAVLVAAAWLAGCTDGRSYDQAVAVLIDVSGTYADQKAEVARIVKREVLPSLVPGDTIALIRIDSESYETDNLEALFTLDRRPSRANTQKLALAKRLDAFAEGAERAQYTDIPGAMMLAADYLHETEAGSRVILVFSDMLAELPAGTRREFKPRELDGIHVVAMNVKHLQADNADPGIYRDRLARWERAVTAAASPGWRTLLDAARLGPYLAEIR